MAERLQKWLAARGYGSRRKIEALIRDGLIQVDGKTAVLGQKIAGSERILLDGKPIRQPDNTPQEQRTLVYHKPAGEICTREDPQGRRTIFKSLPRVVGSRWVSVGRLDYQTTGLLLVTTDGELANRLMHPSGELEREYVVRALGELSEKQLQRLQNGIKLEDGIARFSEIHVTPGTSANKSYRVTVSEGRNRIVRRLFDAVDCRVNRLMRVRYGPISLPKNLRAGEYRELDSEELELLRAAVSP